MISKINYRKEHLKIRKDRYEQFQIDTKINQPRRIFLLLPLANEKIKSEESVGSNQHSWSQRANTKILYNQHKFVFKKIFNITVSGNLAIIRKNFVNRNILRSIINNPNLLCVGFIKPVSFSMKTGRQSQSIIGINKKVTQKYQFIDKYDLINRLRHFPCSPNIMLENDNNILDIAIFHLILTINRFEIQIITGIQHN